MPGPGYYAPFGPNGTWNYYETVTTATTWTAAEANAQGQTFMGVKGNLPTVRSAAEVTYLNSLMGGATSNVEYWTGLTNSTAYPDAYDYGPTDYGPLPAAGIAPSSTAIPITSITYSGTTATVTTSVANGTAGPTASGETGEQVIIAGATPALYDGTFRVTSTSGTSGNYTFTYTMTGTPTSNASGTMTATVPQRGDGYVWVDGEAFTYQNWESGQPNDSSSGIGPANYVAAVPNGGTWDDRSQTNSSYPYVIEFNTDLASPPDSGHLSVVGVQTTSSTLTTISQGISLIASRHGDSHQLHGRRGRLLRSGRRGLRGAFHVLPLRRQRDGADGLGPRFRRSGPGHDPDRRTGDLHLRRHQQRRVPTVDRRADLHGQQHGNDLRQHDDLQRHADDCRLPGRDDVYGRGLVPDRPVLLQRRSDAPRLELSAAVGTQTSFGSSFHLIGDTTNGGLSLGGTYVAPPFTVGVNTSLAVTHRPP